jgi:hypothetical protein
MGGVANPTQISSISFLGADFTTVIVTARYECFSDIPTVIRLKKDDDTFSVVNICPVRHWGEGPESNYDNPGGGSGSGGADSGTPGGDPSGGTNGGAPGLAPP